MNLNVSNLEQIINDPYLMQSLSFKTQKKYALKDEKIKKSCEKTLIQVVYTPFLREIHMYKHILWRQNTCTCSVFEIKGCACPEIRKNSQIGPKLLENLHMQPL
jgi:hypothetical protein